MKSIFEGVEQFHKEFLNSASSHIHQIDKSKELRVNLIDDRTLGEEVPIKQNEPSLH